MSNTDSFVVVRVIRSKVGDNTYPTAVEASAAADRLAIANPGREYSIAHVSYPLEGQVES